jgi:hypothetical protein
MAKRTETQNPEEENLENVVHTAEATGGETEPQEVEQTDADGAQDGGIRCMVSQVKDGETKVSDTLDEGWDADGVAIVSGDETLLVVALTEQQTAFGGDESEDLEEDIPSPGMTSMDGEQRSAFLLDFYQREGKAVPALDACKDFGWLPSGGEMALIFAHKDAVNAKIAELGGTPIGDGKYWTSQRFSNERMWHCDMSSGQFGIALGTKSVAGVRAVKK